MNKKDETDNYVNMQDWVTEICAKNFDDTKNKIVESWFFKKSTAHLYYLIDEIFQVMMIRPKSATLLALLLKEMIGSDTTTGEFIKKKIIEKVTLITEIYSKNICSLVMLRLLYELEVFSFSEIISIASDTRSVLVHALIYLYFYGISKVISAPLIEYCIDKNLTLSTYRAVNDILMVLDQDEATLEDLKQCIYCCYPRKSTEYAIKFDDLKMLEKIVGQSLRFDFNAKIKDTIFEYCPHVKELTLAEYAAFCGSRKCFEYLRSEGANCQTARDYSVASGDIDFIRLCLDGDEVSNKAILLACRLRRNAVLMWALDRKHKISMKDIAEECVRSNNIGGLKIVVEKNFNLAELMPYRNPLIIASKKLYFYMVCAIATFCPRIRVTHEDLNNLEKERIVDKNIITLLQKRLEKTPIAPVPRDKVVR